jgi:hypothetical protein
MAGEALVSGGVEHRHRGSHEQLLEHAVALLANERTSYKIRTLGRKPGSRPSRPAPSSGIRLITTLVLSISR